MNGGAPVHLVSGVTNLQIYYGVQTNPRCSNNSADTYLDAMRYGRQLLEQGGLGEDHGDVRQSAVRTPSPAQTMNTPQTIHFTRVIDVMNKTGVTT